MNRIRLTKYGFSGLLALWLAGSTFLVFVITMGNRISHAVVSMGLGLVLLWVFGGGALMFLLRDKVRVVVQHMAGSWQIKFVLFATLLALVEEAITVSMTNLAPRFGVQIGEAYITASANYLDVVLHHSVIVFIPWFVAWALLLKRFDISPFMVFLLAGLNGLMAEVLTFGVTHLTEFGLWIFVYGLMVYLPAYSLPPAEKRGAHTPRNWQLSLAFILPFLLGIPWAFIINVISPNHPDIHFPPIHP